MSTLPITWNLHIDWNDDGDVAVFPATDTGEDCAGNLLSASWQRGRTDVTGDFGVGTCTLELLNTSGDYSPFNTGSPIYPNVFPGREVYLRPTHNSIDYADGGFRGTITEITETVDPRGRPVVRLTCADRFHKWSQKNYSIAQQEDQTVAALIATLVVTSGLDFGPVPTFEAGGTFYTVPQFWTHNMAATEAVRMAMKQNMGGQVWINGRGQLTVQGRYSRSKNTSLITLTDPTYISLGLREGDVIDEVQFYRAGLDVSADVEVLYTMFPASRTLPVGSSDPLNTIDGEYQTGATNVVTPVLTTDYTAEDSAGNDVSSFLTPTFTSYGGGFRCVFTNNYHTSVTLTLFQVRGQPVRRSSEERRITVTNSSAPVRDVVLRDSFDFVDDVEALNAYATLKLARRSKLQPRPIVKVVGDTDAKIVAILKGEIGQRVTLTNTTGMYPTSLNDDFIIEHVSIDLRPPGNYLEATWTLAHEDLAEANYFRISGASGAGQDNSQIVAAGATTGDRLGFRWNEASTERRSQRAHQHHRGVAQRRSLPFV